MESRKTISKLPNEGEYTKKARVTQHGGIKGSSTKYLARFERELIRIFGHTRFDEETASCSPKDEKELENLVEEYAKKLVRT